jgi:serine/threonine protein kinase
MLHATQTKQSASANALHGLWPAPINGKLKLDLQEIAHSILFMTPCNGFSSVCRDPVLAATRPRMANLMQQRGTLAPASRAAVIVAAGTVAYQAPEILAEEVSETSRVCEMYSFGVTVWECLTDKIPHKGKKESSVVILAANRKHVPMLPVPLEPLSIDLSKEDLSIGLSKEDLSIGLSKEEVVAWESLKAVASPCLSRDRKSRPTASQVVDMWKNNQRPHLVLLEDLDVVVPMKVTSPGATAPTDAPSTACLPCPLGHNSPLIVVPSTDMYQCDICNLYLTPGDKMYCCKTCPETWSVCAKHDGLSIWQELREQPPALLYNSSSTTSTTTTTTLTTSRKCPWDHAIPITVVPPNMIYQCDICDVDLLPGTAMYCCSKCPGCWSVCVNHYFQ